MATKKQSATKRILSEARELSNAHGSEGIVAAPLEDDMYTFHFTFAGPQGTPFEGGLYHGKIQLPSAYPFAPPDLVVLTPNGRWETGRKICLTFTGFHSETWQPAWGVRTALLGVQALMGSEEANGMGIGSIRSPENERRRLARLSREWTCDVCKKSNQALLDEALQSAPHPTESEASSSSKVQEREVPVTSSDSLVSPDAPQAPVGPFVSPDEHQGASSSSLSRDEITSAQPAAAVPPTSPAPIADPPPAPSEHDGGTSEPVEPKDPSQSITAPSTVSTPPSPPQLPSSVLDMPGPAQTSTSVPKQLPSSALDMPSQAQSSSSVPMADPRPVEGQVAPPDPSQELLDRVPQLPSTVLRQRRAAPASTAPGVPRTRERSGPADPEGTFLEVQLLTQRRAQLRRKRSTQEFMIIVLSITLAFRLLNFFFVPLSPAELRDMQQSPPPDPMTPTGWSLANDW